MNDSSSYVHPVDRISNGAIVQIRDQLMASTKKVYRLESGDPSFDVLPNIKNAITKALQENKTHYTEAAGIPELRVQLAIKLLQQNQLPADMRNIAITNGAMHALYLTFMCLLDPQDEVIIPNPMWTEIAEHIKLAGGVPVYAPVSYTVADIESRINPKTKAIFVNNPHNPTGHIISRDDLQKIAKLAEERNLMIISDEAYEHIVFGNQKHASIGTFTAGPKDRTISIFSASKSYAMSGLRVGYVYSTNEQFMGRVRKLLRCTINGVNSATQYGVIAALCDGDTTEWQIEMKASYEARKNILMGELAQWPELSIKTPAGGFFLWACVRPNPYFRDGTELSGKLLAKGIGNVPGTAFGPNNDEFIRFSFSGKTKMIQEAAVALHDFHDSLK